jgi:hypothetical protein
MSLKTTSTTGFERKFNPALQATTPLEFEKYLQSNPLVPFPQHIRIKSTNTGFELKEEIALSMRI